MPERVHRKSGRDNEELHHKPLDPADLDNPQPVPGAHLMLHSVEVVFYRLLRETKAICNFLVGEPFGDQWD